MTLSELYNFNKALSNEYIESALISGEARVLQSIIKFHVEASNNDLTYTIDGIEWSAIKMERLLKETKMSKTTFLKSREGLFDKKLIAKACTMIPTATMLSKITLYHPIESAILKLAEEGKRIQCEINKGKSLNYVKFYGEPQPLFDTVNIDAITDQMIEGSTFSTFDSARNRPLKEKNKSFNPSSSESLRDSSEEVRHHEVTFPPSSSSDTTPNKKRLLKKTNKTSSVSTDKEEPSPVLKKKIIKKTTEKPVSETSSQLRCSDSTDDEGDEESISLPSKGPRTARGRQSTIDESETILKSIPVKKKFDRAKFKGAGPGMNRKFENVEVSANIQKYIDTWNEYSEGDESVHPLDEFHRKGPTKGIEQTKKYKSVVKALRKMINGTLWKDVGKISLDEFERMIERLLDCAYDKEVFPKNKEWIQRNLHLDFALLGMMGTIQPLFLQYSLENPQIIVRHIPKNEDLADDMREQYAKIILGFKKKQWSAKEINKLNKASNDLIRFVNEHKRVLDMRYTLFDYLDWLFEAVVWYYRTKMKSDITVGHMCSPYTWETVFPQYLTEQKIMDSGL